MRRKTAKIALFTILIIVVGSVLYHYVSGYVKSRPTLQYTFNQELTTGISYPDTSFAVISDLHYYDNSLGTNGKAFEEYCNSDRKLLADSEELLKFAVQNIIQSGVKNVLISGDLTKDGESVCHKSVSSVLSELVKKGIGVYVVPGNHDINNTESIKYEGDTEISVPNITSAQFTEFYSDMGYKNAIYRDKNSLSYVTELENNLWLVALDSCRYRENVNGKQPIVSGKFSQSQEKWLEDVLKKARDNGKAVIALMHHGVVEHWEGQNRLHSGYLVQDYRYIGKLLASYGVRLVFTGHYHAQDIAMADYGDDGYIYDIETNSLVTSPCSIRYCKISNNEINISSAGIAKSLKPDTDYAEKADKMVLDSVAAVAYKTLKKYFVPDKDARIISRHVAAAFSAHYYGDEDISIKPEFKENELGIWSRIAYSTQKYAVKGLWNDSFPADNNVTLKLK